MPIDKSSGDVMLRVPVSVSAQHGASSTAAPLLVAVITACRWSVLIYYDHYSSPAG